MFLDTAYSVLVRTVTAYCVLRIAHGGNYCSYPYGLSGHSELESKTRKTRLDC